MVLCAGTTKSTVEPHCIQIMEDTSDSGTSSLFLSMKDQPPGDYRAKMDLWAMNFGFDVKTNTAAWCTISKLGRI